MGDAYPPFSASKIRNIEVSRAVVEAGRRSEEDRMRRIATGVALGALMLVLAAGVALAVLEVGNNGRNTLVGTTGNNDGQDTLFGLGADDKLVGKSAADQLVGGSGPDLLEGNDGNDTLVGGGGRDRIFTGGGFDLVFAFDGNRDYINCNGGGRYRIVFDRRLDRLDRCPGSGSARTSATSLGSDSGGPGTAVSLD
jgi:Ca2+-binding RTX toxin-like protein